MMLLKDFWIVSEGNSERRKDRIRQSEELSRFRVFKKLFGNLGGLNILALAFFKVI